MGDSLNAFKSLKKELEHVALNSLDESVPFVVECDASDVAISATLNQRGCAVAFMPVRCKAGSCITLHARKKPRL